jgi:hypothetical protein
MQIIPLEEILKIRQLNAKHALPIDDIIIPLIKNGNWTLFMPNVDIRYTFEMKHSFYQLTQFGFSHSVVVLMDPLHWAEVSKYIYIYIYICINMYVYNEMDVYVYVFLHVNMIFNYFYNIYVYRLIK